MDKSVTDGAPALALGVDPADEGVMTQPTRQRGEGVITSGMWIGILFTGALTALGTLLVLDGSLPGGLIDGAGSMRYAQTMAFPTVVFFSLFTVFNARSDEQSACWAVLESQALGGGCVVAVFTSSGDLPSVPAAGIFNRESERRRLAFLRYGRELSALAP